MSGEGDRPDELVVSAEARRLHDLRQPLSAVLAAASALQANPSLSSDEREALLDVIIRSAERLGDMLDPSA